MILPQKKNTTIREIVDLNWKKKDYIENKIKIDKMKENKIREIAKVTNDMKERTTEKKINKWRKWPNADKTMDFKPNRTL